MSLCSGLVLITSFSAFADFDYGLSGTGHSLSGIQLASNEQLPDFESSSQDEGESETESKPETGSIDLSRSYNSFSENADWVSQWWGRPARDHIYLGMWTVHLQPGKDQENTNNLIGMTYDGYFGGTFINTHGDRTWSAGWQRTLFQERYGDIEVEAGYRAGMMYGYRKFLNLYDTGFFPLLQTVLDIDYKGFGVQLSWAGVVVTAGFYYRF